jgi:putative selenium metabolism hydrolase
MNSLKPVDCEAMIVFAQRLVHTPSLSTQEGAVAALLVGEMQRLGYDDVRLDAMGNVIGRIGPPDGRKLLYNGHMDTVGVGDETAWQRAPHGGEIVDGVLYGRGASDMKGALAAMVYAGRAIKERAAQLRGALYVVAVVQEEPCEGAAMRHVVEREGVRPDWVVLGEATNLQIARGQRGRIELVVKTQGRSCHASAPERGVNAIYEASRLIVGLELLAPQLNQDSFLGRGTIAVTEIHAESGSHNVVPDVCSLIVDRRLTIGETETRALTEVRRVLTREGIKGTVEIPVYRAESHTGWPIEAPQTYPYWITSEAEPLLLTASRVIEAELGFLPRLGRWDFSTDGVYTMGVAGIPTIGFGPGEERFAHTVQEQIRVKDIEAAARVYAALALQMLS